MCPPIIVIRYEPFSLVMFSLKNDLVSIGCCIKLPCVVWLMNNSNLFLTVLEAVKFKTKACVLCGPTCLFIEWHLAVISLGGNG